MNLPLKDYQIKMLKGYAKGELAVISAGRQTGKSTYYQYANMLNEVFRQPPVRVISTAEVDGAQWYTVTCNKNASMWFHETYRDSENQMWHEHIDPNWVMTRNCFDMQESLYIMLRMKFE